MRVHHAFRLAGRAGCVEDVGWWGRIEAVRARAAVRPVHWRGGEPVHRAAPPAIVGDPLDWRHRSVDQPLQVPFGGDEGRGRAIGDDLPSAPRRHRVVDRHITGIQHQRAEDRRIERERFRRRDADAVAGLHPGAPQRGRDAKRLVEIVVVAVRSGRVDASRALAVKTGGVVEIGGEVLAAHVGSPSEAARMTFCRSDVPE